MKTESTCMFVGNRNDVSWNGVNFDIDGTNCIDVPDTAVEELKCHGLVVVENDAHLGRLLKQLDKEKDVEETAVQKRVDDSTITTRVVKQFKPKLSLRKQA